MQCNSCGSQLPVDGGYCPACGAVTPYNISASGVSPYDPTAASSPSGAPLQAPPPTDYGYPPYGIPQQNPYEPLNPYEAPLRPPPPKRRRVWLWLVLVVLVVLVGLYGGVKALVSQPSVTATTTQTPQDIYNQATSGTPFLDDPLSDNSKGYGWSVYTNASASCQFTEGAYAASTPLNYANFCYATATNFSNFAFEMQMKIIKGDCGAILFRVNSANKSFYYFVICQNGLYAVGTLNGSAWHDLINFQPGSAINQGLGQTNLVAVVARGSSLDLYVNHQKINSISDGTYSQGQIGACASGHYGDPTEVLFSNAKVWIL